MKEVTDWQAKLDDLLTRVKLVEDVDTTAEKEETPVDASEMKCTDQHAELEAENVPNDASEMKSTDQDTELAEEELAGDAADRSRKRCKLLAEGGEKFRDDKEDKEQGMGVPGPSGDGGDTSRPAALGRMGEKGFSREPGGIPAPTSREPGGIPALAGGGDSGHDAAQEEAADTEEASHAAVSVGKDGDDSDCRTLDGRGVEEAAEKAGEERGPVFVLEPRLRVLGGPIRLEDAAERR